MTREEKKVEEFTLYSQELELTHCKTYFASIPSHGIKRRGMRDGEGGRAKECIGRYKKGVKAVAVLDEISPRTSERAVIYVAGNNGRPVPAVLVVYSTSLKREKDKRNKEKEGRYRDHANIIVDLGKRHMSTRAWSVLILIIVIIFFA